MIPVHVTAPDGAAGPDGSMANLNSHSKSVTQHTGLQSLAECCLCSTLP